MSRVMDTSGCRAAHGRASVRTSCRTFKTFLFHDSHGPPGETGPGGSAGMTSIPAPPARLREGLHVRAAHTERAGAASGLWLQSTVIVSGTTRTLPRWGRVL